MSDLSNNGRFSQPRSGLRQLCGGRQYCGGLGEALEVLDSGGEENLILGACEASQPEAFEVQVALQIHAAAMTDQPVRAPYRD